MNKAIIEFLNYTNDYLKCGGRIDLKIKHTFRVMRLCEEIASSLNLSEEEIHVAKIIGLLHDIGRFEQWKKYETFSDKDSIDHADLGVKILKKNNYLRCFIEDDKYDDIIIKSVKYHNKYKLPKNLTKKELLFVRLIRDADKIDILRLYTIKGIDLELDKNSFSDEVYNLLLNKKEISRKSLTNKTDRLSISLGFIFDINYLYSFKYLKDKKYFDIIVDMYKKKSKNKEFGSQLDEILKVINNYIEVSLC